VAFEFRRSSAELVATHDINVAPFIDVMLVLLVLLVLLVIFMVDLLRAGGYLKVALVSRQVPQ